MPKEFWIVLSNFVVSRLPGHYSDVIMSAIVSQIIGVSNVCSTLCWGTNQRKHQSSGPLAFVRGIHWWQMDSSQKGQWRGKCFHLMTPSRDDRTSVRQYHIFGTIRQCLPPATRPWYVTVFAMVCVVLSMICLDICRYDPPDSAPITALLTQYLVYVFPLTPWILQWTYKRLWRQLDDCKDTQVKIVFKASIHTPKLSRNLENYVDNFAITLKFTRCVPRQHY